MGDTFLDGDVDFHALTANPSVIYGWYWKLYKSTDAGKSWAFPDAKGLPQKEKGHPIFTYYFLTVDPSDEIHFGQEQIKGCIKAVMAARTGRGLMQCQMSLYLQYI